MQRQRIESGVGAGHSRSHTWASSNCKAPAGFRPHCGRRCLSSRSEKLSHGRRKGDRCLRALNRDEGHRDEAAERWLQQLERSDRIGSEYGEGYIQYRIAGEPRRLDVDTLNEELKIRGGARLRLLMKPDEAFGMIFDFDGVIADTRQAKRRAWERVAEEEGLPLPRNDQLIHDKIYDMRLERAITEVLQWTREWSHAKALAWKVAVAYGEDFGRISEPQPGVKEWLQVLSKANVPCAVVSAFDRLSVRAALERMGLREFFIASITHEDGMETKSQRYLSAAIKLSRPPDHCVVYGTCLAGVTAAHNCTMKAVVVQSRHLQQADISVVSLSELAVYNIRRLFANRGSEFMSLQRAADDKEPVRRRIRNGTL